MLHCIKYIDEYIFVQSTEKKGFFLVVGLGWSTQSPGDLAYYAAAVVGCLVCIV